METIIDEELLAVLYSQAEVIKDQECKRAMNKLSAYHTLGEIEQKVLRDMSHSIVNKLLAEPTKALKEAAERAMRFTALEQNGGIARALLLRTMYTLTASAGR